MTPQEMFNKAYIGVVKQGCAGSLNGVCVYRVASTGNMCAFGHVIKGVVPEDSPLWEAKGSVKVLLSRRYDPAVTPIQFVYNSAELYSLAGVIQDAHDEADEQEAYETSSLNPVSFVAIFKSKMEEVAEDYALAIPEVA